MLTADVLGAVAAAGRTSRSSRILAFFENTTEDIFVPITNLDYCNAPSVIFFAEGALEITIDY